MSGSFTCARCRHSRPSRFIASSPEGVVCGPMPEGRGMCDRSCSCTERSDPCWKPCRILALERNREEGRRETVAFSIAALLERMRLKPTATNPRPMPSDHLSLGGRGAGKTYWARQHREMMVTQWFRDHPDSATCLIWNGATQLVETHHRPTSSS